MSVRLVDEIVSTFESHGFQHRAAMAECSDRQCRDMQFAQCWQKVYADVEHDGTMLRSSAVQETIVRRLLRLGRLMRERCWDFAIAERLAVEDVYMAVAVRLLAHACAPSRGTAVLPQPQSAAVSHGGETARRGVWRDRAGTVDRFAADAGLVTGRDGAGTRRQLRHLSRRRAQPVIGGP